MEKALRPGILRVNHVNALTSPETACSHRRFKGAIRFQTRMVIRVILGQVRGANAPWSRSVGYAPRQRSGSR